MADGNVASVDEEETSIVGAAIARGTARTPSAIMFAATTANRIPLNDMVPRWRMHRNGLRGGINVKKARKEVDDRFGCLQVDHQDS